ncbi:MAG: hypothetical protein NZ770_00415, partial [Candidatus Poseidoniaceae archaeon]|nr:hypothetical protein [Candidatus Poseidoniaceae archaeon]
MAADRVWMWRIFIATTLFCSVLALPDAGEHLDAWRIEQGVFEDDTDSQTADEGLDSGSNASQEQSSEEETEQGQSGQNGTEDSQADSSEPTDDEASGLDDGDGDSQDSGQQENTPEAGADQNSRDSERMLSEDGGVSGSGEYSWVLPTTQIVVLSLAAVLAMGLMGTMLTAVIASEAGRVSLMLAVIGPILAISQRGEAGTFTKGRIQGYVEAHPGIHFSALRDALSLANGVTAHHLHALEKEGRIISWLDGPKRRYASTGIDPKLLSKLEQPVVGMQQAILEVLSSAGALG